MSSDIASLRTLEQQTPPGWQIPKQWTPPAHVPADSAQVLAYHNQTRLAVLMAVVTTVSIGVVVTVVSAVTLRQSHSGVGPGVGDGCPASFGLSGQLECTCNAGQSGGSVWGTGIYTADSSVCRAAVHAGAIPAAGGRVKAVPAPGCAAYGGTTRNGVASSSWGSYQRSFYFPGFGNGQCAAQSAQRGGCPGNFAAAGPELECTCSAQQVAGSVWGTNVYTADSSICKAALHAGAIPAAGGKVTVKAAPGCASYAGTEQRGVTTSDWGSYQRSFYFPGFGSPQCGGRAATK